MASEKKTKHVVHFGQRNVLSDNTVVIDDRSVHLSKKEKVFVTHRNCHAIVLL
jgi:hypothetical protein